MQAALFHFLSVTSVTILLVWIPMMAHAWSLSSSSRSSTFTGHSFALAASCPGGCRSSLVMFDNHHDPPNDKPSASSSPNAWTVLATTEQWISRTLLNSNSGNGGQNPYSRKEVSYVCEASSDSAMIVANLFRRLKEARELGQAHGRQEVARAEQVGM